MYSLARVLSTGNLGVENKCNNKSIKTQNFGENENQDLSDERKSVIKVVSRA